MLVDHLVDQYRLGNAGEDHLDLVARHADQVHQDDVVEVHRADRQGQDHLDGVEEGLREVRLHQSR